MRLLKIDTHTQQLPVQQNTHTDSLTQPFAQTQALKEAIKTAIIFATVCALALCACVCKKETPLTQQPLLLLQRVVSQSGALTLLLSHKHSHTHTSKRYQAAVESTTRSLVGSRCCCRRRETHTYIAVALEI